MGETPHAESSAQSPQDAKPKMNISEYLAYINDEWARGWIQRAKAETSGVFVSYEYMDMVDGNPYDAMLFSQVMYWHLINQETLQPRISHKHEGHLWIVKTYREWADELHFKSDRTIKQCFTRLAGLGVIIKEKHKSPYHRGNIALYVRIDWCKFAELMKPKAETGQTSDVLPARGSDIKCPTGQTSDVPSEETLNVPSLPDSTEKTTSTEITKQKIANPPPPPDINPAFATATTEYEKNIGPLTPMIADSIRDLLKEVPVEVFTAAIKEAVDYNKRSMAYIKAVLNRWQREGRGAKLKQPPPTDDKPREKKIAEMTAEDFARNKARAMGLEYKHASGE